MLSANYTFYFSQKKFVNINFIKSLETPFVFNKLDNSLPIHFS